MIYLLILMAVFARLVPHPPNFAPVMALSIFAGAYLGRYKGVVVALAAMLLSNAILGFYALPVMLSVYVSMALGGFFGSFIGRRKTLMRVGGAVLGGSTLFFVVTNFAVWASGTMYPKTLDGLLLCYTAAVPFFQNSLAGNVFYSTILFVTYEFLGQKIDSRMAARGWKLGLAQNQGINDE